MGRPSKSDQECFYTEQALAALGLRPVSVAALEHDPPDVRVDLGDRVIAVEVTRYQRDLSPDRKPGLRAHEARLGEIGDAFDQAREAFPELNVDGKVFFKRRPEFVGGVSPDRRLLLPDRNEVKPFVRQLLRFAQAHEARLSRQGTAFDDFGQGFELIGDYVERLVLETYDWTPVWVFDPVAKRHGFAKDQWPRHVTHKTERIRTAQADYPGRFDAYDEIWLLIVSNPAYSSQSVAATLDMFRGCRELSEATDASPFRVVLVHECSRPGKTWRWDRGQGWREYRHHEDAGDL